MHVHSSAPRSSCGFFGTIEESRKGLNLEPLYLDDYCFYAFVPVRNLDNAIPVVNTHIAE
jgi:hypothetical protein